MPVSSFSITSADGCSCTSSTSATNTFRPSIREASDESGRNLDAVSSTARLLVVCVIRRRSAGEAARIRSASENTIRACSRVVSAE